MAIRWRDVTITTDASGAGTAASQPLCGVLQAVVYRKPSVTPFSDGGTVTVTHTYSGATIWREVAVNASTSRFPVTTACDAGGTALSTTYLQHPVSETVTVTVSGCGASKVGTYRFVYDAGGEPS